MTERPAMSADGGIRSRPEAHLGFREERAFSHHSGEVWVRVRVGEFEEGEADSEEEKGGVITLELTEAK